MGEAFLDTMGFYSLLDIKDQWHKKACRLLQDASSAKTLLITTDYILDETATLLKARNLSHVIGDFFKIIDRSRVLHIESIDAERFQKTRALFLKSIDQHWSFTDCSSFVIMQERSIRHAFTHDHHFEAAGFSCMIR